MSEYSTNESNEGTLEGVFRTVLTKFQQNLNICLPCIVTKVDRNKNKVSVLPLIKLLLADGTDISRSVVSNVLIQNISVKGFIINMPIKIGDMGWLRSCDRDISLFKQNYKENKPNTKRKNSFEDGVFIPDVIDTTDMVIDSEDDDNLVIQSLDGSVKISLGEEDIKMKTPTRISLESDEINIKATTKINIESAEIENTADIHTFIDGSISHNGVNVGNTHTHSQSPDSNGNTEQDTSTPQ